MPDYKAAQKQLDDLAADWQKNIDAQQAELDNMYKVFEAEQVMLSDDLKKKREGQLYFFASRQQGHLIVFERLYNRAFYPECTLYQ